MEEAEHRFCFRWEVLGQLLQEVKAGVAHSPLEFHGERDDREWAIAGAFSGLRQACRNAIMDGCLVALHSLAPRRDGDGDVEVDLLCS